MEDFTIKLDASLQDVPADAIARLRVALNDCAPEDVTVVMGIGEEIVVQLPALAPEASVDLNARQKQMERVQRLLAQGCEAAGLLFVWFVIDPPTEWASD
jgi:hypothetical protein